MIKHCRADRHFYRGVALYIYQDLQNGNIRFAKAPELSEPTPDGYATEPTVVLSREETQELIDDLYRLGFRPTDAGESVGALAATTKHLEDMRQIAFGKISIIKP